MSYHIGKNGNPAICRAREGNCPLKNSDGSPTQHFETRKEAIDAAELKHKQESLIKKASLSKNNVSLRNKLLSVNDGSYPEEILVQLSDYLTKNKIEPLTIIAGGSKLYNSQIPNKPVHDYDFTVFSEPKHMKDKIVQKMMGELDVNVIPASVVLDKVGRSLPMIESLAAYRHNVNLYLNNDNVWTPYLKNISVNPLSHRQLIHDFFGANLIGVEEPVDPESKYYRNYKHSIRYSIYLRRNDFDNFDPRLSESEREYFLETFHSGKYTPEIRSFLSEVDGIKSKKTYFDSLEEERFNQVQSSF